MRLSSLTLSFQEKKLMRKLRTFSMAVVLALAFASHSFAGIIDSPPEAPSNQQSVMAAIVLAVVQIVVP